MIIFFVILLMFPITTANDYFYDDSEPEWISWDVNQVNPYQNTEIIYLGKCNCECE
jgi:hypothetical protein